MSEETTKLRAEIEGLRRELEDLRILNENTVEHSTNLENELIEQNMKLDLLQNKMKKYLSPQLYQSLVGGTTDAVLVHKRKAKRENLPPEVRRYFCGEEVDDGWICYPWDAEDIDRHEALA